MSANPLLPNTSGMGRRQSQPPARHDFSKIKTSARIPNLIEIQRDSYNRFLQMDLLPEEREATGLQAVFRSVFPISDFRGTAELDFVEFHIGNWQCKCGRLEGLRYLRANCKNCGALVKVDPLTPGESLCHNCGTFNAVRPTLCDNCGEPVGLKHKHDQQECQGRRAARAAAAAPPHTHPPPPARGRRVRRVANPRPRPDQWPTLPAPTRG